MSELRFNAITNEWVIIAPQRAVRPSDFRRTDERPEVPTWSERCPFCPGNEHLCAPETFRVAGPEADSWYTRVVENKYPAVTPGGAPPEHRYHGLELSVDGYGAHEVIIETQRHNTSPAELPAEPMVAIVETYRARYRTHADDPNIAHIIIFKNHGVTAGTSLIHPHSQLIATPVVSTQVQQRLSVYDAHFEQHQGCLVCESIDQEVSAGTRVLWETPHFLAVIPFAALSAFHTWILPKRHTPSFGDMRDEELRDLSRTLRAVLRMLRSALNDPDYNYVIRSRPERFGDNFHWYLSIVPRVAKAAGFELGSGMYINSSKPEDSAALLREHAPRVGAARSPGRTTLEIQKPDPVESSG